MPEIEEMIMDTLNSFPEFRDSWEPGSMEGRKPLDAGTFDNDKPYSRPEPLWIGPEEWAILAPKISNSA